MDINQLLAILNRGLDPSLSQQQRIIDYKFCEEFKSSNSSVSVSLELLRRPDNPSHIKHFALHALDFFIRHRWNSASVEEKLHIKDAVKSILQLEQSSSSEPLVASSFARVFCEMAKREYPQHWPSMLAEFSELAALGAFQAEVVILALLCLSEDAVVLQTLEPASRRKDIRGALLASSAQLLALLHSQLATHLLALASPTPSAAARTLCTGALDALDSLLSWLPPKDLQLSMPALLILLSRALPLGIGINALSGAPSPDPVVAAPAVGGHISDTLLNVIQATLSRKAASESQMRLLEVLLGSDNTAILVLLSARLMDAALHDAAQYEFLKKLTALFGGLVNLVCSVADSYRNTRPAQQWLEASHVGGSLEPLVRALHSLTAFPSYANAELALRCWPQLLAHKPLGAHSALLGALPGLLSLCATLASPKMALALWSYHPPPPQTPAASDSLTGAQFAVHAHFARVDFDDLASLHSFCTGPLVQRVAQVLKTVAAGEPDFAFKFTAELVHSLLQKPINRQLVLREAANDVAEICSETSLSALEWGAAACVTEAVLPRLFQADASGEESFVLADPSHRVAALNLLRELLDFCVPDPLILESVLRCLIAAFPFVRFDTSFVIPITQKLFGCLKFELPGQCRASRFRSVIDLRRTSGIGIMKLSTSYSSLLLPFLEEYSNFSLQLIENDDSLSHDELLYLFNSNLAVSNGLNHFDSQVHFIEKLSRKSCSIWLSPDINNALSSFANFCKFLGLTEPPPSFAFEKGIESAQKILMHPDTRKRIDVMGILGVLHAVIRRCHVPDVAAEQLAAAGFLIDAPDGSKRLVRNPAFALFRLVSERFFQLATYIGNLFNPSLRAEHLHEFYAKPQYLSASGMPVASANGSCGPPRSIFEMPWKQKEALLQMGKSVEASDGGALTRNKIKQGTFFERWQNFLTIIYSSSCSVMGDLCESATAEVFLQAELCQRLNTAFLLNLPGLPHFHLRCFLRHLLRPLLSSFSQRFYTPHLSGSPTAAAATGAPPAAAVSYELEARICNELFVPLLYNSCYFFLVHVHPDWLKLQKRIESRENAMHSGAVGADGDTESSELEEDEVVREAALRLVTRDMADVLDAALIVKPGPPPSKAQQSPEQPAAAAANGDAEAIDRADDSSDETEMNAADARQKKAQQQTQTSLFRGITPAGQRLVAHPTAGDALLALLSTMMSYRDQPTATKAIQLMNEAVNQMLESGSLTEEIVRGFWVAELNSMRINGSDDSFFSNINGSLHLFETLRARYSSMMELLNALPGVNAAQVAQFQQHLHERADLLSGTSASHPNVKMSPDTFNRRRNQLFRAALKPCAISALSTRYRDTDAEPIAALRPVFQLGARVLKPSPRRGPRSLAACAAMSENCAADEEQLEGDASLLPLDEADLPSLFEA